MENSVLENKSLRQHKRSAKLMGNMFTINVVTDDDDFAGHCIDKAIAEIQRIEKLLTTFSDDSQTNQINAMAGIRPVVADREVFDLIERSLRISSLTQGAFDITYGSIDKSLWNFDRSMKALPDPKTARKMVHLINYKNVILDENECSVFLKNKGMRIGFGGIGKGYAADRAKKILTDMGVRSGIVNASGDLTTWGTQPDGEPWTFCIADPNTKVPFSYVPLRNMSVATSGNYEKFIVIQGRRYSHTIDPKTGLPTSGVKSVTVISPVAELSDALATPITVMGVEAGLHMINQMKGIACIIIDDEDKIYTSKNISLSQ